jgi:hypothetical protein
VLVPLVVVIALATGLDPVALAFLSTAAAGYCLTTTVAAKPMQLFARLDGPTYGPADLVRLSRVLIPVHLIVLLVFATVVWPVLGLSLRAAPGAEAAVGGRPPLSVAATAPTVAVPSPTDEAAQGVTAPSPLPTEPVLPQPASQPPDVVPDPIVAVPALPITDVVIHPNPLDDADDADDGDD